MSSTRRILSCCLICIAIQSGNIGAATLPGLTNWWPAEGNANDVQGSDHGTPVGGVSFEPGRLGQCFSFNGVDAYIDFGTDLGNFGTSDFSIVFWLRGHIDREAVLGKRPRCDTCSFFDFRTTSYTLEVELMEDLQGTDFNSFTTDANVVDGEWHHVGIVREGVEARIYLDGELDANNATAGTTNIHNDSHLRAGLSTCTGIDGTGWFSGQLDELRFYNRALSDSEIAYLYECTEGPYYSLALSIINGSWGITNADPNWPNYPSGKPVTLTATPVEGKAFKHWVVYDPNYPGDANHAVLDSNNPITIVMMADREVTAVFKCGSSVGPLLPLVGGLGMLLLVKRRS